MYTIVITGRPGIGKSTLFNNIVNRLRIEGFKVGGIVAPEVRDNSGRRLGFKIVDLLSSEEAWLARKDANSSVRVGRYGVLVKEASRIISNALARALREADVIAIDEVGPMELKIPAFRHYLHLVLESDKPRILVIHYRLRDPDILNKIEKAEKHIVTESNRDRLNRELPERVVNIIKGYYKQ
ncbi:MAG: NTPase [Thermoprotei archaeon]